MRISDWSSDVCSSDLPGPVHLSIPLGDLSREVDVPRPATETPPPVLPHSDPAAIREVVERLAAAQRPACIAGSTAERRVGNFGAMTCKYLWSPYPIKKE